MSTTEDAGGVASTAPKGRAKACTACRQVKLKCDAKEVYPSPCTRCKTQNLDCRMDPTFKRVPARRQLEEVSERLINLQRSLGLDEDSSLPSAAANVPNPPRFDRLSDQPEREPLRRASTGQESADSFGHADTHQTFLNLNNEPHQGQWTLGDVTLTYQDILPLFEHFDSVLFRHVPFLEPCNSLHILYNTNDLLFWTIALVSCRFYNQYDDLYRQLSPHHRTLLAMRTFGSRVTLESIHSLLIQCTWPYPVNSQYDDITWMLCGVAINLAMIIGLHKPNHGHEYLLNEEMPVAGTPFTRKMTWLACFQISTSIASWLGVPVPISSTSHLEIIDGLCQDATLPRGYRAKVEIQRQVSRIVNALDARLDFRTRYSLIKLYEQDLDRVRTTFDDVWADELEVEWLGAKLYLFGMAFLPSGTQPSDADNHARASGAREILQYGLSAGSKMLNTIANMRLPPTMPGENQTGTSNYVYQLAFYPKQIFRIGAFATFFLIWYLAVDVNATDADRNLARDHVEFVYRLLYSVKHSNEHLRAARSIEMMAKFETLAPKTRHQAANLLVNSRLGASFMYSLNYTEDDLCLTQNLIELPPTLGVDTVASNESVQDTASTPSHTTGNTTNPQWPSTERNTESPQGQPVPMPQPQSQASRPSTGMAYPSSQQMPSLPTRQPPGSRPNMPSGNRLPPHMTVSTGMAPTYDPNSIFSNAFFHDASNQNFDFLWQEWDPAVFDDLKMDIDEDLNVGNLNSENEFMQQQQQQQHPPPQ